MPRTVLQELMIWAYVDRFGTRPEDFCLVALADGVIVGAAWSRNGCSYGRNEDCIFSSCLLIPLISILRRLSGECSKGNGYNPRTMSRLTISSMPSTEDSQSWVRHTLSISPKGPDMSIYFSELLILKVYFPIVL